jgi:alpha-mannosidase
MIIDQITLDGWDVQNAHYLKPGEYEPIEGTSRKIDVGDIWARQGQTAFMTKEVDIPKEWDGRYLAMEIQTDGEGLLKVNGHPYHGVDNWRGYIMLDQAVKGGSHYKLEIEGKCGRPWDYVVTDARTPYILSRARLIAIDKVTERYYYDLAVVLDSACCQEDPVLREALLRAIKKAMLNVDFRAAGNDEFKSGLAKASEALKENLSEIKFGDNTAGVYLVGHSHIDLAWLWPLKETMRKVGRTYSTVTTLMEEFPDYKFVCSQVPLFLWLKAQYPEIYEKVKARAAEGRFEPIGGTWVEHDCNMLSGESFVRQCLYGQRFFKSEFGVDVRVGWLPDVFGYSWAMPQIYKKAGLDYFMTAKLTWNDTNRFPYNTFWWQGADGTKMMTHIHFGPYNNEANPAEIAKCWKNNLNKLEFPEFLETFGYGDGGGGPTRQMLEYIPRMKDIPGLPKAETGSAHAFFDRMREEAVDLPVWNGELYYEMHRGTYTSQAWNKRYNRLSELLYRDLEIWSSMAGLYGYAYPKETINENWHTILLNQFHDIIPGSSITEVYNVSHEDYRGVLDDGACMKAQAVDKLAEGIDTSGSGVPVVVFNSVSWERNGSVSVEAPYSSCRVLKSSGADVPCQVSDGVLTFSACNVPSMGYEVYHVVQGSASQQTPFTFDGKTIKTPFYEVKLSADGTFDHVLDLENKREVIADGCRGNILQVFDDRPSKEEAWDIELHYQDKGAEFVQEGPVKLIENGPARLVLGRTLKYGTSVLDQKVVFYANSRRIDFINDIDWQERKAVLKAAFPVSVQSCRATYEIPYGAIERPTHWNTTWDLARFEVSGHRWADLSESGYGVSVLNDCKYGWDIKDNVIRLTLLRAPEYPDPIADKGRHEFTYSLLPHAGDWTCGTIREAAELNIPLTAVQTEHRKGTLGASHSFVSVDNPKAIIDTIKQAEDSDDMIVRVYESCGSRGPVSLKFDRPISKASECNLLEAEIDSVDCDGSTLKFFIKPFELRTFKVAFD